MERFSDRIMEMTDDQLMESIAQGEHSAFRTLFDRYGALVLGYSTRLLGDREKAEDITQEVWLRVVRHAKKYHGSNQFIAWIYTITRNLVFKEWRKNKVFSQKIDLIESIDESILPSSENLEQLMINETERSLLKQEIDLLPTMQRAALLMRVTEELPYEEIASGLKISISAVKSLLFRARETLERKVRRKND